MVHQERSKQSAAVSCPSKGYFTQKAAKNSTLFESKLFDNIWVANSDVRPLNEVMGDSVMGSRKSIGFGS